jgi:hypothetical protein
MYPDVPSKCQQRAFSSKWQSQCGCRMLTDLSSLMWALFETSHRVISQDGLSGSYDPVSVELASYVPVARNGATLRV